ncbi:phosphotransferase [Rhodococcus sp. NPDC060090]|uniref:phosphotransferase n=1 Tax=Rhodococcus sp. NPDC060090 TaxID=3347056 RepID=UPI00365CFFC9
MSNTVVSDIAELTPEWLSAALDAPVHSVRAEPIGTGQVGTCHRLELTGDGVPERLVAKLPAADTGMRAMLAGAYRGEVRFYTDLAATVAVRAPRCHFAALGDDGNFTLLLEDLAPARQGDQIRGCTPVEALDAVRNLADLHAPRWNDADLLGLEWLGRPDEAQARMLSELYGPAVDTFVADLGDLLDDSDTDTLRSCVDATERWMTARSERFTVLHGDYRLDNLMFPDDGAPGVTAVDWQTITLGLPARDLAYFLGTSLPPALRRDHEHHLVTAYHRRLVEQGVERFAFAECWDDYRFGVLQGPLIAVFGCAFGTRTERGDRMFAAMVARSCAAIRDLDSFGVIG